MSLSTKDKQRCMDLLQSFIDKGYTLEDIQEMNSFFNSAIYCRQQALISRFERELKKRPFHELLAETPGLDKDYSDPALMFDLQRSSVKQISCPHCGDVLGEEQLAAYK